MEVYLNNIKDLSLFKEFPFLLGFIPRGVSGMAKIFDFRTACHDKTVVYSSSSEEITEFEAMTRKVKKLISLLNSDAIYDGIVDGVRLTIYKEVDDEGDYEFYKFFFIVRYDD